jgi:prepilin-type N-terminal cleavage/methylation domain-containing protein
MKTLSKKEMTQTHNSPQGGFTLIELMIVIIVVAILTTIALPAMNDFIEKNRLKNAAELVFGQLNYARSESIKTSADVYVSFIADGSAVWSLGISDTTGCVSTAALGDANDCTLPVSAEDATAVLKTSLNTAASPRFKDIQMTAYSDSAMTTTANPYESQFKFVRGTADVGVIKLVSPSGWEIRVIITALGHISMCSPSGTASVSGYPEC